MAFCFLSESMKISRTQTFAGYQTASLRSQMSSFRHNLACNTGKTLNVVQHKSLIPNGWGGESLHAPTNPE